MVNLKIGGKVIGEKEPSYIIAEMSGNHNGDIQRALEIVEAAAEAGVDAIKLQTYTADTITLNCDNEYFQTQKGSLWEGRTLHDLYGEAYTPWEWHEPIMERAGKLGLTCFSTPFDFTAVDFLEEMNVPAYKIASYEIQDIPLIRKVARTGKPIMMSTGIATLEDIYIAVEACREEGNEQIVLLKCTSAYPSPYEEINLNVIPNMKQTFGCICGISDHTMGMEVAVASVALGAEVVEKHITLSRADGGVDAAFSMEPKEFADMVTQIRNVEKAKGCVTYELTEKQKDGRQFGRSLFVSEDICEGDKFTEKNIRSVRPALGLATKHYENILGKIAACDLKKGTPLSWEMIR
ncbi:MAG: pseudaminic acid synthase [Lachnospiraceae bacterium]|jgi:pseudaminic acid synthase|nr:pseudaminic acid synthase [Lachnospiraceae bacterium]